MPEINPRNVRTWSMLGQRGTVFTMMLPELAQKREDIMVLTADLSLLSGLERYKSTYPKQFLDVGIAEQNMIGIAAGLAKEGNCVFATTYATFATMRCFEQIRNNMGVMKFNIKVIGSSAGVAMGTSGNCHHSIEDIAIMRAIPNMRVICPADAVEAAKAIEAVSNDNEPAYVRLTGNLNCPVVYKEDYEYTIGKANVLREGSKVAIVAVGTMVSEALQAADRLKDHGIDATVADMHTVKPLDNECLDKLKDNHELIVTVEEHSVIGGLGGAVAEYIACHNTNMRQLMIGFNDTFSNMGSYEYILHENGLYADAICEKIVKYM